MSESLPTTVTLNGSPCTLSEPTIASALEAVQLSVKSSHVAIALNDVVVRRAAWEQCTLKDGDRMEIITAVAGG